MIVWVTIPLMASLPPRASRFAAVGRLSSASEKLADANTVEPLVG